MANLPIWQVKAYQNEMKDKIEIKKKFEHFKVLGK